MTNLDDAISRLEAQLISAEEAARETRQPQQEPETPQTPTEVFLAQIKTAQEKGGGWHSIPLTGE